MQKPLRRHPQFLVLMVVLPVLGIVEGQIQSVVGDPKVLVDLLDQPHDRRKLLLDLVLPAEDMRVVERHGPYPVQPGQRPRLLVAVHPPQFGNADRQVAVRALILLVDHDVVGTVHRLEHQLVVIYLHWGIHGLAEVVPVPRDFVELHGGEIRRIDMKVTVLQLQVDDVVLEETPHSCSPRQPQREPLPQFLGKGE